MKRILFLLLLTVSVYGQNPSRFAKIQITGNTTSGTATKVNVQEANGEVNTQTINTGFNKNIGLGGSDVVGATILLNQYSTTPIDWTATAFNSGQVVFYGGKQWIAKMATVDWDVPSVSSKWEEITFEALANKTVIVDAIPTDGSNNAVSSNGVFDELAIKAPISSVHNPVTIDTANGLSLSNQQLSLGLASSGVTGALSGTDWNTFNNKVSNATHTGDVTGAAALTIANSVVTNSKLANVATSTIKGRVTASTGVVEDLTAAQVRTLLNVANGANNYVHPASHPASIITQDASNRFVTDTEKSTWNGKQNAIAGLTTNYLPKWNGSGFGNSVIREATDDIVWIGETSTDEVPLSVFSTKNVSSVGFKASGTANQFNVRIGAEGEDFILKTQNAIRFRVKSSGRILINKTDDNGVDAVQVNGTISASPATLPNQVVVKSQLDAVASRPYKVYTALLSQSGTNAPVATVLENTLGGTVVWSRNSNGVYYGTLSGAFTVDKTGIMATPSFSNIIVSAISADNNSIIIRTSSSGTLSDSGLTNVLTEIRVYN